MTNRLVAASLVTALSVSLVLAPCSAFADEANSEGSTSAWSGTYDITLSAGQQGTFDSGDKIVYKGQAPGTQIDFNEVVTLPEDSKYYVKGIRPAALNNAYTDDYVSVLNNSSMTDSSNSLSGSVVVTEDADYVVAYGIKANRVEYTVSYVDSDGNAIHDPSSYTGDVGDTPAAVALYIEGYIPTAYKIVGKLGEVASDNSFTFEYRKLPPGYVTLPNPDGTITIVTPAGETVVVGGVPAGAAGAGGAAGGDAPVVTTPEGEVILDDEGNPLTAPVDEEVLEDDANPLASGSDTAVDEGSPSAGVDWLVPTLLGALALFAAVLAALIIRKKRADN